MADSVMTSSMPNMPNLDIAKENQSELDKITDRLTKFRSPSKLPKPEISPKPAYLAAQLAKPKLEKNADLPIANSGKDNQSPEKATTSMLKSTLKRMTKLTTSPLSRSSSFREPVQAKPVVAKNTPIGGSMQRSNSLRKIRNKENSGNSNTLGNYALSRSGTSGTLDSRNSGIKRTPSMNTMRRFRDRDLNVKLSRGVQTQLTKDTVDEPEYSEDGSGIPTSLEFTVYLPDLFGSDNDQVETHVSESLEPIDVRKNRQLTLDNMKLHRELEKLKQSANEHDLVKKELRQVKAKLEDEQRLRTKIEGQLDNHNKKVKEIAQSMDSVEREFEKRDAIIYDLEGQVKAEKSKMEALEAEVQKAKKIIEAQRLELLAARKAQKTLVEQCEHVEGESRELQEFLQIEKMALSETLKDAEGEVEKLKEALQSKEIEVKEAENRCGHLVRIGEQRHQELLTSQQQLTSFSAVAKNLLINQGTELYQISAKLASVMAKVNSNPDECYAKVKDSQTVRNEIEALFQQIQNDQEDSQQSSNCNSLQNLSLAIEKRRKSQTLINGNSNSSNTTENLVLEQLEQLEQIIEKFMDSESKALANGSSKSEQNGISQLNSTLPNSESIEEMKAKFMRHQQIYKKNYEDAEIEIKRMDELYQDLIENVLTTLGGMPDVVNTQPELQRLKSTLETEAASGESPLHHPVAPSMKNGIMTSVNLELPQDNTHDNNLSL